MAAEMPLTGHVRPVRGEQASAARRAAKTIARKTLSFECSGSRRCRNPKRVARIKTAACRCGDRARWTLIDTLGRRACVYGARRKARERKAGENPVEAFIACPGRVETQGSIQRFGTLIRFCAARDSREGQNPGTAACRAGPQLRLRKQRQGKR
jgi:hypothetical protein